MRFFVTGVNGQLGHDVVNEIIKRGYEAVASDITETYSGLSDGTEVTKAPYVQLDITDSEKVEKVILDLKADKVIHCAAWTAVDKAEDEENFEKVKAINVKGTESIAKACKKADLVMTYLSTDYVFNGKGETPWEPDDKNYAPINVYGKTKLDGELLVSSILEKYFIVRIAWVFGINGNNFIKTMLSVGKNHDELRVVNDQIGTPTYTLDLARLLVDMNETEKFGYYHATNEGGFISWYDFACEIFKRATKLNIFDYSKLKVNPVSTEEYGLSKAKRPFNSRLSKEKLTLNGFERLPDWKDALERYLKALKEEGLAKSKTINKREEKWDRLK